MKCENCNKEVEKGYMETIETVNYIFYICEECLLDIEEKLLVFIQDNKKVFGAGK